MGPVGRREHKSIPARRLLATLQGHPDHRQIQNLFKHRISGHGLEMRQISAHSRVNAKHRRSEQFVRIGKGPLDVVDVHAYRCLHVTHYCCDYHRCRWTHISHRPSHQATYGWQHVHAVSHFQIKPFVMNSTVSGTGGAQMRVNQRTSTHTCREEPRAALPRRCSMRSCNWFAMDDISMRAEPSSRFEGPSEDVETLQRAVGHVPVCGMLIGSIDLHMHVLEVAELGTNTCVEGSQMEAQMAPQTKRAADSEGHPPGTQHTRATPIVHTHCVLYFSTTPPGQSQLG